LYRNPDGSTVLHVDDEHDEILVTVDPDGSMLEERWSGLAGVGEALAAASPYDKMQVPNAAGRKVWTHLIEDESPAAVPEPEPEPAPGPPPSRRVDPQYQPPDSRTGADSLDPASVPGSSENRAFIRWLS
jgi:hypothetical protein